MSLLKQYGAAAQTLIPAMEAYILFLEEEHPHTDMGRPGPEKFYRRQIPWIRDAIDSIKASKEKPELISIHEHLEVK